MKERLTEELLERLLAASSPEAYLADEGVVDRELADYLRELLDAKGLKRAAVIRDCGINSTFGYDIFAGKTRPGRDRAIMLAFGIRCDLRQTQRLLRLAGVASCGASSGATRSSSGALSTAFPAPRPTTSCIAWARRPFWGRTGWFKGFFLSCGERASGQATSPSRPPIQLPTEEPCC